MSNPAGELGRRVRKSSAGGNPPAAVSTHGVATPGEHAASAAAGGRGVWRLAPLGPSEEGSQAAAERRRVRQAPGDGPEGEPADLIEELNNTPEAEGAAEEDRRKEP